MSKAFIIICSYSVVVFTSVVLMLGVGISQGKKVWAKSLEALSLPAPPCLYVTISKIDISDYS